MARAVAWLKVLGWALCGAAVGYALPMLLSYGVLSELRRAGRPQVSLFWIQAGEGMAAWVPAASVASCAIVSGVVSLIALRPWLGSTEERS